MRFCALCVTGALLAVLLKRTNPDMALLLALAVCGAAYLAGMVAMTMHGMKN